MDKALIDLVIFDLQKAKKEINIFSKEYLFDKKYAQHRNQIAMLGGPSMSRSYLSLLLREAMTEENRNRLFPGNYDLGNMWSLMPQFCKSDSDEPDEYALAEEITQEMWREKKLDKDQSIDNSRLKKIKAGIAELTGRKMEQHYARNKSTALKVVKLLYRMNNDRWSAPSASDTGNKRQLIAMLRWPQGVKDYSLSFRHAYPYKENTDQVALIADLKMYLSVELDEETYEKIGALQFFLHEYLSNAERNVGQAFNRMHYPDQVKAYRHLADEVTLFTHDPQPADIALDEALFFYLNALEFAHFAEGYRDLLQKAKSNCAVLSVLPVIDKFAKDLMESDSVGMHDPILSPNDIRDFLKDSTELLCLIVGKALGEKITPLELIKTTDYVLNLLCTDAMFRKQWVNGDMTASLFTILECVAAICCVYDELRKNESERTKCAPYWKGQAAQGGSILTMLKTAPVGQDKFKDPVPEEHRHIWAIRLEWFMALLQGHAELKTQQLAFRTALIEKVKEIVKTNNLMAVHVNLQKLGLMLGKRVTETF